MHTFPKPRHPSEVSRGFSLPEIAISIAILSVAFVSLFALLPVGLSGFRESMDKSNENWIMQGLNSMVQTLDWKNVWGVDSKNLTEDVFYFDEQGRLLDTKKTEGDFTPSKEPQRVYEVKLFIEPLYRPSDASSSDLIVASPMGSGAINPAAVRVVALMANLNNQRAKTEFNTVDDFASLENIPKGTPLTIRSFVVSNMNSAKTP